VKPNANSKDNIIGSDVSKPGDNEVDTVSYSCTKRNGKLEMI